MEVVGGCLHKRHRRQGFDHQHRMAVRALPVGGKAHRGSGAAPWLAKLGRGAPGQDKEATVVGHQAQATMALSRANHPIHWSRELEVLWLER